MGVLIVMIDGAQSADYSGLPLLQKAEEKGLVCNTPAGMEACSLSCIMNILGVDSADIPSGRSYLEALAANIEVGDNDLVFRCNGITQKNGILTSSCVFQKPPILPANARFIPLGGYKNLLILKDCKEDFEGITTFAPHDYIGEEIKKILPHSKKPELQSFLRELLTKHDLWTWGQAVKSDIPSFYKLHNLTGAVVCKTEIVKGIAKAMDLYCPDVKNTTADIDTDLLEKARTALELTKSYDLTILHINGADEAAHRKNQAQKSEFIKKITTEVISYLLDNSAENTAVIITSDHATDAKTGKHSNLPVDYYIFNKNEECARWLKRL